MNPTRTLVKEATDNSQSFLTSWSHQLLKVQVQGENQFQKLRGRVTKEASRNQSLASTWQLCTHAPVCTYGHEHKFNTHSHKHAHALSHTYILTYTLIYAYTHTQTYMHIHMHSSTQCTHTHMPTHACTWACTQMHLHAHMHSHAHAHTCTHTHMNSHIQMHLGFSPRQLEKAGTQERFLSIKQF